jgi:hypothetical protein
VYLPIDDHDYIEDNHLELYDDLDKYLALTGKYWPPYNLKDARARGFADAKEWHMGLKAAIRASTKSAGP